MLVLMLCMRKHREPVEGCHSCRMLATRPDYRAALAQRQGIELPDVPLAPKRERTPKPPPSGPGTELKKMFALMGIKACSSCNSYAARMDAWKVDGCREHFEEIVTYLEEKASRMGLVKWAAAGVKAAVHGLPLTARGLAEEAIKRSVPAPPPVD